MYGNKPKCKELIEADNEFFNACDKQFNTRKEASAYYSSRGWDYFYKNDMETAMKRFNQAWLLDSLNYQSYWGFGNIYGMNNKYSESLEYFNMAEKLNNKNPRLLESMSSSYLNIFNETKDVVYLDKGIEYLKKSFAIDSSNNRVLSFLVKAYNYYVQRDSATKYLRIIDARDPSLIDDTTRQQIKKGQ
jgi:tetratricopeptide (TPR) repeat protein